MKRITRSPAKPIANLGLVPGDGVIVGSGGWVMVEGERVVGVEHVDGPNGPWRRCRRSKGAFIVSKRYVRFLSR